MAVAWLPGVNWPTLAETFACRYGRLLCWFLDAGNEEAPHAQLTGVQKAPRHEVAGG